MTQNAFNPRILSYEAAIGRLNWTEADFAWITGELRTLATRHAGGRLVSMLEGGYNLEALAECAVAHVGALRD